MRFLPFALLLAFSQDGGPLRMPVYARGDPPAPRSLKEVEAALAGSKSSKTRQIHVALVAGKKDHGVGEHDYPAWLEVWSRLLGKAGKARVSTAMGWPSEEQLRTADVLVFYQKGTWTAAQAMDIDGVLARGGGLVYLHWAVGAGRETEEKAKRIGLTWKNGQSKFRHGPVKLAFDRKGGHPIVRNFEKVRFHDESYWRLGGDPERINVLATGMEEGKPWPLLWTREEGKGRVFVSILGHYSWTFDDPLFRLLILRAIAWAAKEPVDRFNGVVLPGARVSSR